MNDILTEDNFLTYAMNHYDNPQCTSIEEFQADLKRFKYLQKLFIRYRKSGDIRERLILNHIIVLYNIFGTNATNMLFYKIEKSSWKYLISFLLYLNRMPDMIPQYGISIENCEIDETIINKLKQL